MTPAVIPRPQETEYPEYFAGYLSLVPEGNILQILDTQGAHTAALLRGLPAEWGGHRYAPGKWSVNQVIGHVADTERVFTYRALAFSRGDSQPLPGFEQDDWVRNADFNDRSPADLADEFLAVRDATLALFRTMSPTLLGRRGTADARTYTVRAIPFILAGHEHHHVVVLRNRYL